MFQIVIHSKFQLHKWEVKQCNQAYFIYKYILISRLVFLCVLSIPLHNIARVGRYISLSPVDQLQRQLCEILLQFVLYLIKIWVTENWNYFKHTFQMVNFIIFSQRSIYLAIICKDVWKTWAMTKLCVKKELSSSSEIILWAFEVVFFLVILFFYSLEIFYVWCTLKIIWLIFFVSTYSTFFHINL